MKCEFRCVLSKVPNSQARKLRIPKNVLLKMGDNRVIETLQATGGGYSLRLSKVIIFRSGDASYITVPSTMLDGYKDRMKLDVRIEY